MIFSLIRQLDTFCQLLLLLLATAGEFDAVAAARAEALG